MQLYFDDLINVVGGHAVVHGTSLGSEAVVHRGKSKAASQDVSQLDEVKDFSKNAKKVCPKTVNWL